MPKQSAAALARTLDLLAALGVLTATAPLFAGITLALWMESPGPILVGVGRLRFRTVRMSRDGRVNGRSELGRQLYLARLDELPQFISLLKGDVTLFGNTAPALSLGA
jgi:lipopolysaccharide/colanic/teichoic acid biosynthesis glycosyltransferase